MKYVPIISTKVETLKDVMSRQSRCVFLDCLTYLYQRTSRSEQNKIKTEERNEKKAALYNINSNNVACKI